MKNRKVKVADICKLGVSKVTIYKHIRAGKLTFKNGKADPVKLLEEWDAKRDPARDDKIGPVLRQIVEQCGLTVPEAPRKAGQPVPNATDSNGAPLHLSVEMQRFWKRVLSEYELESDALLILRTACEAWDRAQLAREAILQDGLIINGRRHAGVDIEAQSQSLFLRAMRALGLDIVAPGPIGRPGGR